MFITQCETFVLDDRCALVRLATDDGHIGWGEITVEGLPSATAAVVSALTPRLLGENPLEISRLWQILARGTFYRGGVVLASAVAGIDQALWDIKGRWHGAPVHELLGGPSRHHARIYTHANAAGRTGDAESARNAVANGYSLVKIAPELPARFVETPGFLNQFVAEVAEIRAAVGDHIEIAIDLHGRFSLPLARSALYALADLGISFVEEPLRPEQGHLLGRLVSGSSIPIATGERLYSVGEFRPVLEAGVAIVQPDLAHAGGITEVMRIATLADVHGAQVAPHCPLGPIALAASLQIAFAIDGFLIQEQGLGLHGSDDPRLGLVHNPEVLHATAGKVARLAGAGLGVDVDEGAVRRAALHSSPTSTTTVWAHDDGSFAEW